MRLTDLLISSRGLSVVSMMLLSLSMAHATSITLTTGYLERKSDLSVDQVVMLTRTGAAEDMVGQTVTLERGIDPLSGNVDPNTPNYYSKMVASAGATRLKIYNQGSLDFMPVGTFIKPQDPNSFSFTRTDFTGYAEAELIDTLRISGGSGQGMINMSFQITGSGSNPFGLSSIQANVCPFVSGQNGCVPQGVSVNSATQNFDRMFTYSFPFTYGLDFQLDVPFYSWIFINEPSGPGNYYAGGVLDALHTLEFRIDSVSNDSNVVNPNASVSASSGFDYSRPLGADSSVPEPSSGIFLAGALAFGWTLRFVKRR